MISNFIIIVIFCFLSCFAFFKDSKAVFKPSDDVYYMGSSQKNEVSLMINVYWGEEYLDDMLKILENNEVKATFFVGGLWVSKNPEMLEKIYSKGHEIGNHGFYHKNQDKLNLTQNKQEILNNHKLVKEILGIDMNLFAPPSGAYSQNTTKAASELGYKTILWSKDTIDWRDKNTTLIKNRATKNLKNGDLILMHPTKNTLQALQGIITNILSQNFKIVCVSHNISSNIV